MLCLAIYLCGVDKIVVHASGFWVGRYQDSGKHGVIDNCVPILCVVAMEWEERDNEKNVLILYVVSIQIATWRGCRREIFDIFMILFWYNEYASSSKICVKSLSSS